MIRLQKYLAMCGVDSRRKCEEHIKNGLVKVNGKVITEMGFSVDPENDHVRYGDKSIRLNNHMVYILMNKPSGVVTTSKDQFGRTNIVDLLQKKVSERVYPVGRLDYETEGLIILTNDGELANKITHPKSHISKKYQVVVKGKVEKDTIEKLRNGIDIGGYVTKKAVVDLVECRDGKTELKVTIWEGKNRQIRRMFEKAGHEVVYLKRIAIGPVKDDELKKGEWRYMDFAEVNTIRESIDIKEQKLMVQQGKYIPSGKKKIIRSVKQIMKNN